MLLLHRTFYGIHSFADAYGLKQICKNFIKELQKKTFTILLLSVLLLIKAETRRVLQDFTH